MAEYIKKSKENDMRIASGAAERERDRAIWKVYSKRGGVYDALQDFCKAVKKPSSNAFDYDEEEGTYIICITLYNTIWMQMNDDMTKLDKSLAEAEKQKQNYVPATHTRTYTKVRKVPKNQKPQPEKNANRILQCCKAFDKWMMRFKFYSAIHHVIASLFPSSVTDTDVPMTERYECTETLYEESELELLSYKSVHSQLLEIVRGILGDMEKGLPLIKGEDRQALEDYKREAQRICSRIEENVFSRQEWLL